MKFKFQEHDIFFWDWWIYRAFQLRWNKIFRKKPWMAAGAIVYMKEWLNQNLDSLDLTDDQKQFTRDSMNMSYKEVLEKQ